jgi:SRSO17 transposase
MLLAPIERKNAWQMAEASGQKNPYGFQNLLGRAHWKADSVRDSHLEWIAHKMKVDDPENPNGTLVLDETGFLKKGEHSAGVGRQYSGTAGRIENCQIGVFLSLMTSSGRTFLDRELYLPESWCQDPERCQKAGIPAYRIQHHQTKGTLGLWMLKRAWMAGIRPAWVTGDEVYGRDYGLRLWLEQKEQPYVLAVQSNTYFHTRQFFGFQKTAKQFLELVLPQAWQRLSCGTGCKGQRTYDWALIPTLSWGLPSHYQRALLFRRSISDPTDIAYYRVACDPKTKPEEIVSAAGSRWSVEECFESGKGEVGLDEYEVRSFTGWYRHMTLAMIAHAILTLTRAHFLKVDLNERKKKPQPSMAAFLAARGLGHASP